MAGEVLRKRREDLSLNIKEVSELLKINSDYLVAIENDSFENLPVEVYTKGYIRCYAKYLDMDPEPILQYYTDRVSRPNPSTLIPVTFFKRKRSKLFYLIPVFFMTFFALYIFFSLPGGITEKTSVNSNNVPVMKPIDTQADDTSRNISENYQQISGEKEHSLSIKADEVAWIFLQFGNGKSEEILLQPGESKKWKFEDSILLKIGNIGGIKLNLDGEDLDISGKSGEVITLSLPKNE